MKIMNWTKPFMTNEIPFFEDQHEQDRQALSLFV